MFALRRRCLATASAATAGKGWVPIIRAPPSKGPSCVQAVDGFALSKTVRDVSPPFFVSVLANYQKSVLGAIHQKGHGLEEGAAGKDQQDVLINDKELDIPTQRDLLEFKDVSEQVWTGLTAPTTAHLMAILAVKETQPHFGAGFISQCVLACLPQRLDGSALGAYALEAAALALGNIAQFLQSPENAKTCATDRSAKTGLTQVASVLQRSANRLLGDRRVIARLSVESAVDVAHCWAQAGIVNDLLLRTIHEIIHSDCVGGTPTPTLLKAAHTWNRAGVTRHKIIFPIANEIVYNRLDADMSAAEIARFIQVTADASVSLAFAFSRAVLRLMRLSLEEERWFLRVAHRFTGATSNERDSWAPEPLRAIARVGSDASTIFVGSAYARFSARDAARMRSNLCQMLLADARAESNSPAPSLFSSPPPPPPAPPVAPVTALDLVNHQNAERAAKLPELLTGLFASMVKMDQYDFRLVWMGATLLDSGLDGGARSPVARAGRRLATYLKSASLDTRLAVYHVLVASAGNPPVRAIRWVTDLVLSALATGAPENGGHADLAPVGQLKKFVHSTLLGKNPDFDSASVRSAGGSRRLRRWSEALLAAVPAHRVADLDRAFIARILTLALLLREAAAQAGLAAAPGDPLGALCRDLLIALRQNVQHWLRAELRHQLWPALQEFDSRLPGRSASVLPAPGPPASALTAARGPAALPAPAAFEALRQAALAEFVGAQCLDMHARWVRFHGGDLRVPQLAAPAPHEAFLPGNAGPGRLTAALLGRGRGGQGAMEMGLKGGAGNSVCGAGATPALTAGDDEMISANVCVEPLVAGEAVAECGGAAAAPAGAADAAAAGGARAGAAESVDDFMTSLSITTLLYCRSLCDGQTFAPTSETVAQLAHRTTTSELKALTDLLTVANMHFRNREKIAADAARKREVDEKHTKMLRGKRDAEVRLARQWTKRYAEFRDYLDGVDFSSVNKFEAPCALIMKKIQYSCAIRQKKSRDATRIPQPVVERKYEQFPVIRHGPNEVHHLRGARLVKQSQPFMISMVNRAQRRGYRNRFAVDIIPNVMLGPFADIIVAVPVNISGAKRRAATTTNSIVRVPRLSRKRSRERF